MYDKSIIRKLSPKVNRYFEKLFDYPDFLIPGFDSESDSKDFTNLLSNKKYSDLILEFGSGSGAHLISLAKLKPNAFVVGFEIRFKRSVRTIQKALEQNITNICVFRGRSEKASELLGNNSVNEVYINFPDPWAKKRWYKHRILSQETIDMLNGILIPGGIVSVKTDHQDYFSDFLKSIEDHPNFPFQIEYHTRNLASDIDYPEANIKTEFENLFRTQGKPVCYIRLKKY